jgi:hypothetical protein
MRGWGIGMRWLAAVLLGLAGCHSTDPNNLKPDLPEEFVLPPDDPRFNAPVPYPKEVLNQGLPKKDPGRGGEGMRGPGSGMGRFGAGAGPGMGGY